MVIPISCCVTLLGSSSASLSRLRFPVPSPLPIFPCLVRRKNQKRQSPTFFSPKGQWISESEAPRPSKNRGRGQSPGVFRSMFRSLSCQRRTLMSSAFRCDSAVRLRLCSLAWQSKHKTWRLARSKHRASISSLVRAPSTALIWWTARRWVTAPHRLHRQLAAVFISMASLAHRLEPTSRRYSLSLLITRCLFLLIFSLLHRTDPTAQAWPYYYQLSRYFSCCA